MRTAGNSWALPFCDQNLTFIVRRVREYVLSILSSHAYSFPHEQLSNQKSWFPIVPLESVNQARSKNILFVIIYYYPNIQKMTSK